LHTCGPATSTGAAAKDYESTVESVVSLEKKGRKECRHAVARAPGGR
jgi:hypothetical protein